MKKKFHYRNANKQKGMILREYDGGPWHFRICGEDGAFKDYKILYNDLEVEILDSDAELLESEDGTEFYLDYSRKVLGQETKYSRIDNGVDD